MTIAGIKPVDHAYWLANNTEYYDREKVRKILELGEDISEVVYPEYWEKILDAFA